MPASSICCMMPAMTTSSAVAQRIHVHFHRILKKVVDQHGALLGVFDRFLHVPAHGIGIIGNHHGPAAKHVGGPYQHRVADAFRAVKRFFDAGYHGARRLGNLQVLQQLAETACGLQPDRWTREKFPESARPRPSMARRDSKESDRRTGRSSLSRRLRLPRARIRPTHLRASAVRSTSRSLVS